MVELREQHSAPPLTAGSVASLSEPTNETEPRLSDSQQVQFSGPRTEPAAADTGVNSNGHRAAEPPAATASHPEVVVPYGLRVAASWSWRLILVAMMVYVLARVLGALAEVVVPVAIAILLAALLTPVSEQLRRWGMPRAWAVAFTMLGGLAMIVGALTLITSQIVSQATVLSDNVGTAFGDLAAYLQNGPLNVGAQYLSTDAWLERIQSFLAESESSIAGFAAEIGTEIGHFVAGFAITLFALFYFLYDGRGIFGFLLLFVPREVRARVDHAAAKGWRSLSHYVRATILVAASNGFGVLIAALIIGVPVAPALAALVFIGSFVPLVGAFVSGFVSVAVALVALGWVKALLMLAAIIAVVQIEGHILQPLLLGRAVKLHPLAVLLAIAIGIILGGVVGALIAVPILAFSKSFVQYLMGAPDPVAVRLRWPTTGRRR
jgi:predicted PurR-regulated permease PerM